MTNSDLRLYVAEGNKIFVDSHCSVDKELFLTVHPTDSSAVTPEQQAVMIADMLERTWGYEAK